jgi:ABC-type phosphate transport system substrate-binding protein
VRFDRALRIGLVTTFGVVLLGTLAPATAPAGAAGGPTVTSTPPTALLDGQFVNVTWTGFPASAPPDSLEAVSISQCKAAPVHAMTDCAPSITGVSDTAGAGIASLQLHTGTVLARDAVSTFACDHATACSIAVYLDPTKPISPPKSGYPAASTQIAFGFPASDCPHGGTGVSGTGAEAVNRAMLAWEAAVCEPPSSLDLQYTRTESTAGKQAFIGRPGFPKPDFAVTSVPFSASDIAALKAQKRTFGYAPVAASGLVFAFHGTDRVTGQTLTHLTLTPSELAHIFNGERNSMPTSPGDPESQDIIDLNPGVNFWPNMLAFGRLDGAAGTLEATSFFLAAAPTAWKQLPSYVGTRPSRDGGPSETVDYTTPTENMPDGLEGPGATNQLLNGPDILAITLQGGGQGVGNDPATTNFGYLDASTAAFYGLPTVCIQMDPNWRTTHTPCVSASPASIAAALAVARHNSDGTVTPSWNPSNHAAYPMLDVSYLIAPTNLGATPAAETLQKLIQYAAGHGAGSGVVPEGYADVSADLTKQALATAAAVTNKPPSPPPTTTTTTTTPPTTPAPAPTGSGIGSLGGSGNPFGGGSSFNDSSGTPPVTTPATTPTITPAKTVPHAKKSAVSAATAAFARAGAQISGHASWAVLIALTLFCLLGLIFSPVRDVPWIAKRIHWIGARPFVAKPRAWLRGRPWPWRRRPTEVTL